MDEFAFRNVTSHNGTAASFEFGKRVFFIVQPQVGLALCLVRAVALETVFRKNRANVAIESNAWCGVVCRYDGANRNCEDEQQPPNWFAQSRDHNSARALVWGRLSN